MFDVDDITRLLSLAVFVYYQPGMDMSRMQKSWYNANRSQLWCSLPAGTFGIVWAILFGLITASGYLYFPVAAPNLIISVFVLYAVNVVLTKVWTPTFFGRTRQRMGIALFIAILITLTGIAVFSLMAIDGEWTAAGLYAPYILWSLYAVFLNYRFFTGQKANEPVQTEMTTNMSRKKKSRTVNRASHTMRERPAKKKLDLIV